MSTTAIESSQSVSRRKLLTSRDLAGYGFLTPAALGIIVFFLLPFFMAVIISFFDVSLLRPDRATFIGVENYRTIFEDTEFQRAVVNTIIYALIQTPLQTIIGLSLALLIHKSVRGVSLFRTAFYLPVVISMVVASIIWRLMYNPQGGLFNSLLETVGLESQPFLTSTTQALPAIAGMLSWKWAGFSMIIFLAGLLAIPSEVYEAAKVDGARLWTRFTRITLPLLRRSMLFVLVINTVNSFKLFTPVWVITEGGPEFSTTVLVYYMFRLAFRYSELGTASAVATVMLGILLIVLVVEFRLLRSDVEY